MRIGSLASRKHGVLTAIVLVGIAGGFALDWTDRAGASNFVWASTIVVALVPVSLSIARSVARGRIGVDVIALLAMVGAIATGELLAGTVIALMLTGGTALEEYAHRRAERELTHLASRAPREAHLRRSGRIVEVAASTIEPGDVVVVRAGEVVPADGTVVDGVAIIDQSALTGEPMPVRVRAGAEVLSGSSNAGDAFDLRASRRAAESMYASLVALVEGALARKAPMVRLADRYATGFLVLTLIAAGSAWLFASDPVRALAVLVVATPCPLILAPPVALIAGTSRAARIGVIVKGAAAIERLGRVGSVLIDKTGTITMGRPRVLEVVPAPGTTAAELLMLAGSVEQFSVHTLAEAITHAAASAAAPLELPRDVHEEPGSGITGTVHGHAVASGSREYLVRRGVDVPATTSARSGTSTVYVARNGSHLGHIVLGDTVREDARKLVERLRALGVHRIVMATGDHERQAREVADSIGIDEIEADCTPQRKLALLDELRSEQGDRAVVMIGDGVNDAPALAAADIGIAMGSAGATAASESAEAVIVSERISLVADAIEIGSRSRSIALQSIVAGMALSIAAMVAAGAGYLAPVEGALLQEAIDLAVIVNALRAIR